MLYRHDTIAKMNYEEHQALLELESFSGVGFEIREILRDDVYCITLDEKGNISGICTETECTGFFGIKLGWVFQKFPKITKILLRTRKKLLRKSRSPPMQGTLSRSLEQKVNSLPHAQAQVLEEFLGSTFPVPEKISDEFSRGVAFGEKRDRIWIKGLWLCNISRNISEFQKKLKKIAQCKGITHLYVRDNEISRIPLEWMAFENLQVLDLRDNKLIYNPSSWLPGVSVLLEGNPVGIPNSSARPKYFSSRSEKALRTHRKNVRS